jgi:hypothetical protein
LEIRGPQADDLTGPKSEDRYFNSVRDLTVDTGTNNPGVIGVQFCANFVGCVRDVEIHSGDGQGIVGLDMAFATGEGSIGPLLIRTSPCAVSTPASTLKECC